MFIQLLANGLVNAGVIALMATGFALIYTTTRIFHVAHGTVYVLAAYVFHVVGERLQWPRPVAAAVAMVSAALFGLLIEAVVYAPLFRRHAPPVVCLLSSLGIYVAAVNLIAVVFGNEVQVAHPVGGPSLRLGTVFLTSVQVLEIAVCIGALTPVILVLRWTNSGRLIRAVRDNSRLVTSMGINLLTVRRTVFVIGSCLAGIAGVLSVLDSGTDPQSGMPVILSAAVAMIVGGVGSMAGPILGSVVLAMLQSFAVWRISPKWSDALTFGVLILFMVFRPTGLLMPKTRLEELHN